MTILQPPREVADRNVAAFAPEEASPAGPRQPYISASTEIPVGMPYDPAFAERIPLLLAFRFAIGSAMAVHAVRRREEGVFWIAECGVYRGRALRAMALIADEMNCPVRFLGLDSFEGLPDLAAEDVAIAPAGARYLREVMFADTTEREVLAYLEDINRADRITLVRGFFADTLPRLDEHMYTFVNIDCDLYEGHLQCLEYFYPRMLKGGVMFIDDYYSNIYPMGRLATDAFLANKPEKLVSLSFGSDGPPKAMLVKA